MKYFIEQNGRKKCLLCSHYCLLKPSQSGICGVNKNVGDKVSCEVYGFIDALNIDPVEKKPLYHFMPASKSLSLGTVGCNFKCDFCQNHSLSQRHEFSHERYLSPEDIVMLAQKNGCKSISFTYNEPTIFYPYAKDIALLAKAHEIKTIFVTNGFESKEVIADMKGVIDALNIDLKSFNETYYKTLGGKLENVLENIARFNELDFHVELTTLIVPTKNDSKDELKAMANFIKSVHEDIPWHISAFHPAYKQLDLPRTPLKTLQKAHDIAKEAGLNYIYMGNVGAENPTTCPKCGEVLIRRKYFEVVENKIKNSKCPKCGEKIKGVFT